MRKPLRIEEAHLYALHHFEAEWPPGRALGRRPLEPGVSEGLLCSGPLGRVLVEQQRHKVLGLLADPLPAAAFEIQLVQ